MEMPKVRTNTGPKQMLENRPALLYNIPTLWQNQAEELNKPDPTRMPTLEFKGKSFIYTHHLGVPYRELLVVPTKSSPAQGQPPDLTVDIPAMHHLSKQMEAPICGKDYKTGQTLIKTILAPGFKARMIGLNGWFSTNILGNRD